MYTYFYSCRTNVRKPSHLLFYISFIVLVYFYKYFHLVQSYLYSCILLQFNFLSIPRYMASREMIFLVHFVRGNSLKTFFVDLYQVRQKIVRQFDLLSTEKLKELLHLNRHRLFCDVCQRNKGECF